tara:strand:- start:507 stop:836 length:330 start_codon:yes stop_codon:yes gene_type:complete
LQTPSLAINVGPTLELACLKQFIKQVFYAVRIDYQHETLINDENGQRPSGDVQSMLFREHMVGISISKVEARNVFMLLGKLLGAQIQPVVDAVNEKNDVDDDMSAELNG